MKCRKRYDDVPYHRVSTDTTIIFLHIQKTAGTTLHRIIERYYTPEEIYFFDAHTYTYEQFSNLSAAERVSIRMLRGHMVFGPHELLPQPTTYFTVLRDPIERVISHYYHVRRDANHCYHDFLVSNEMDLKAYVESGIHRGMSDFQTRVLAGGKWHNAPYGKCPEEALEAAKENFRKRFAVVGLMERFDETLLFLRRAFGWRDIFYVPQNVSRRRPSKHELAPETLEAIVNVNRVDVKLYAYVKERFNQNVRQLGPVFARKIRAFRLVNRRLGPFLHGKGKAQTGWVRDKIRRGIHWMVS